METLFDIVFWTCLVIAALALLSFVSGRMLHLEATPDAVHFATTTDGWRLALSRFRPIDPIPGAPPVVLCPGIGLSAAVFDLGQENSLARYLARYGYDVWALDLRGRGLSEKPRLGGRRRYTWSFDDYVDFDVPAALEEIHRSTGHDQVQWIGFGQGALTLWAATPGPAGSRIRSAASLAGPLFFRHQSRALPPWVFRLAGLLSLERTSRLLSPLLGRIFPGPLDQLQNRDNVDGTLYRRGLVSTVCSLSRKELRQYRYWLDKDAFCSLDRQRDYRAGLAAVEFPNFFLCGPRDSLAPAEMVEASADALSNVEERVVVLASRMHGMSANYGHLDLLLGRNVQRDVFPHLLKWLDLHCGVYIDHERPEPLQPDGGYALPDREAASDAYLDADTPVTGTPGWPAEPPAKGDGSVSTATAAGAASAYGDEDDPDSDTIEEGPRAAPESEASQPQAAGAGDIAPEKMDDSSDGDLDEALDWALSGDVPRLPHNRR